MILGMPLWFLLALTTAVFWGLGYVFDERLIKSGVTPAFLMLAHVLIILPLYVVAVYLSSSLKEEIAIISSDKKLLFYLIVASLTILGGNLCILYAVKLKSASMASIIEISYPFFIILFSWLFFRDMQVNYWTLIGSVIAFTGISIILLKS